MVASTSPRKSPRKKRLIKALATTRSSAAVVEKAVVLKQFETRGGKVYQVLAPATPPKHLSADDIERAVELMVAAR